MFGWLRRKQLSEALSETRRFRCKGVVFEIQKISVSHFLEGAKVMKRTQDIYKAGKDDNAAFEVSWEKVKAHYADVIIAGVVSPTIVRKESEDGVFIDRLLKDWDMSNQLYEEICLFTYGKKKQYRGSQGQNL